MVFNHLSYTFLPICFIPFYLYVLRAASKYYVVYFRWKICKPRSYRQIVFHTFACFITFDRSEAFTITYYFCSQSISHDILVDVLLFCTRICTIRSRINCGQQPANSLLLIVLLMNYS